MYTIYGINTGEAVGARSCRWRPVHRNSNFPLGYNGKIPAFFYQIQVGYSHNLNTVIPNLRIKNNNQGAILLDTIRKRTFMPLFYSPQINSSQHGWLKGDSTYDSEWWKELMNSLQMEWP